MDRLIEGGSEIDPTNENHQNIITKIEKPYKASNDDDDDDDDHKDDEDEDSNSHHADSSSAVDVVSGNGDTEVATTTSTTDSTEEEIRDVQEMVAKVQGHGDINLHFAGDVSNVSESQDQEPSGQQVEIIRPKSNETDVDDIMSESFTLVTSAHYKSNGISENDLDVDQTCKELVLDDDDDEDDMKELLRFKRQNSRDYLEQAPIDGLLEGIAEEPEEEGVREIEEEYDSVVIKDEEYESGSGSDAANETGKETEESESTEDASQSLVDVVTTDVSVIATATIVNVEGEEDSETNLETSETFQNETVEQPEQNVDSSKVENQVFHPRVDEEETKTEEKIVAETTAEAMHTSPSSSSETTSENAANLETPKGSTEPPADESLINNDEYRNKNHDYVNIGQLGSPANNFDGVTASKAEISDEDFTFEAPDGFDEASVKSSDLPDISCDYVNVDTIRANKRLVSRLIQEGNDEEFERLEAEIESKLEDEEDSDYCIPKPNPVAVKPEDFIFKQFSEINGSEGIDENENLSSSDHQDLASNETGVEDVQLAETKFLGTFNDHSSKIEQNEQPSVTSAAITDIGKDGKIIKENGNLDYDSDVSHDYRHPKPCDILSRRDGQKEDSSTYRGINSLNDSIGAQQVKRSNLKSDQSRLASPACESSHGSRSNDILPEVGSVKALVAQWQQLENRRWSRKDDMTAHSGGESTESRGMNRSRSCGPLPRKVRVLSPDGVLDDEGRRISDWTVVGGSGDIQEQYNSQPSLTRAMLVKFERLDYETSSSANVPPIQKKTFKWEVKEPKTLNRPSFLAH